MEEEESVDFGDPKEEQLSEEAESDTDSEGAKEHKKFFAVSELQAVGIALLNSTAMLSPDLLASFVTGSTSLH